MRLLPVLLFSLLIAPAFSATASTPLVAAARSQVGVTLSYDPRYERLTYPGGDVPPERGVCTDVVVRAYRKLGADLQVLVHEDMKKSWAVYQKNGRWQMKAPDRNIDHRRVPNLATFFGRHGSSLPPSKAPHDYRPGDIVTWLLPGNLTHIGIVSDKQTSSGVPLIIHNIGAGTREEDILFGYAVTGHYRWQPR
ncbi:DUF1287 domain-containing protein [Janthinobacterium aquaticum]|uniref:DUF1287 domain-containing protein n=1 Tax=Janthinobacterium sp. FT58W TaxID=2654254 RepID=UPI00126550A0|nr:DUF1287 domain-containing protein [Janthinobacterium sp. FT58W]KAB8044300.1 DUF1287 domain-containing protein [Janthinobacterium sp. FT58W]